MPIFLDDCVAKVRFSKHAVISIFERLLAHFKGVPQAFLGCYNFHGFTRNDESFIAFWISYVLLVLWDMRTKHPIFSNRILYNDPLLGRIDDRLVIRGTSRQYMRLMSELEESLVLAVLGLSNDLSNDLQ